MALKMALKVALKVILKVIPKVIPKVILKVILKVMHLIYGLKNRLGEILKLLPKNWQELVKKDLQL